MSKVWFYKKLNPLTSIIAKVLHIDKKEYCSEKITLSSAHMITSKNGIASVEVTKTLCDPDEEGQQTQLIIEFKLYLS